MKKRKHQKYLREQNHITLDQIGQKGIAELLGNANHLLLDDTRSYSQ